MKATNINWDVDNEEDLETLPTEIELPKGMTNEDEISDYISDKTGFCHLGFILENEEINPDTTLYASLTHKHKSVGTPKIEITKDIVLHCLKSSSDFHSEICEECPIYSRCDHTWLSNVYKNAIELIENNEKEALTLYEMRLTFSLDLGLKDINSIAKSAGIHEKMLVKNAQKMKLTQTVPFIPNEETLQEYANVIKNNYQSESFTCEACKFIGFDYIRPKTLLETGEIK